MTEEGTKQTSNTPTPAEIERWDREVAAMFEPPPPAPETAEAKRLREIERHATLQKIAERERRKYKGKLRQGLKAVKKDLAGSPILYEGTTYTIVPDWLFCSGKYLSHGEIHFWLVLRKYAVPKRELEGAHAWPSKETIARLMGVTKKQVWSYATGLKKKGMLEIRRRGLNQTNLLILKDPT
jgi:hypothetical protein